MAPRKAGRGGRGSQVESRKQAMTIRLSKARQKGEKVPRQSGWRDNEEKNVKQSNSMMHDTPLQALRFRYPKQVDPPASCLREPARRAAPCGAKQLRLFMSG